MRPFEIVSPTRVRDAMRALGSHDSDAMIYAGGTDLLGEIKEGVVSPDVLVDLGHLDDLKTLQIRHHGSRIGSLVTLAEIARHDEIALQYPALSQAAASVATPQIRNTGTLGGNLCQRPRCWYYRSPHFDCIKKGGDVCFAIGGLNKYHAIMGADSCHIVHPSDTAVALTALGAMFHVWGIERVRNVPAADFFTDSAVDPTSETVLERGDILAEVLLPSYSPGDRSIYLKAKERQAFDFALASVAVYIDMADDGIVRRANIVLGGVAPVPYVLPKVSAAIEGRGMDDIDTRALGRVAVTDARPMSDNAYKIDLAANLVTRALDELLKAEPESIP